MINTDNSAGGGLPAILNINTGHSALYRSESGATKPQSIFESPGKS